MADDTLLIVERTVFSGLNSRDYPACIGAGEVSAARNVDLGLQGLATGVAGCAPVAQSVGSYGIRALRRFRKAGGNDLLMLVESTNLRSWAGGATVSAAIKGDLACDLDTLLVVGNGVLLVSNGTDNVQSWNQTAVSDLGDTNASPPKARVGAYVGNRFILANTRALPDYFWFSNVLSTTFDRATNLFKLNSGAGGEINGIADMGGGEVVFLKDNEIHTVNMADASPANWSSVVSIPDDGSASKRANVRVGSDVFYLSRRYKGVMSVGKNAYNRTYGLSVPVSDPVFRGWMERINWNCAHTSCAAVFENKLVFAVPLDSATAPNTWFVLHLHADASLNGWSVRTSPPASCFECYPVGGAENLYLGRPDRGQLQRAFCGNTDAGTPMVRVLEGRCEDFADSGAKANPKIGWFVELEFLSKADSGSVSVFFQPDEGDYTLLGVVDTNTEALTLPLSLPFRLPADGKIVRRFELDQFQLWNRCRIKLEQTDYDELLLPQVLPFTLPSGANKRFQFLGYRIVARQQPIT